MTKKEKSFPNVFLIFCSRIYTYILNISDWPKKKKSFQNVFFWIYTYIINISNLSKKKKVFKKLFLNFLIPKNLKLQIFNLFRKIEIEFQKKFFNSIWSGNKMKKVLYIHLIGFIFWLPWTPLYFSTLFCHFWLQWSSA